MTHGCRNRDACGKFKRPMSALGQKQTCAVQKPSCPLSANSGHRDKFGLSAIRSPHRHAAKLARTVL